MPIVFSMNQNLNVNIGQSLIRNEGERVRVINFKKKKGKEENKA